LVNSSYDAAALRGAVAHFNRAIARDSALGAAFAGLADAWVGLADGYVTPREGYTRARDAARMALARDSSLGLAYAMLSAAVLALDQNAAEAEAVCQRGLIADPRNGTLHAAFSQALVAAGRLAQGIDEARQAWELDTLVSLAAHWYVRLLLDARQFDTATILVNRTRAVQPTAFTRAIEGELLAARGDLLRAEPLLSWRYYGGQVAGTYVRALVARGDTAAARAVVDSMLAARTPGYFNPVALAKAYTALGDVDRGIEWLQRAFEERTNWLIRVRVDDELAPLRADPRYAALDRQLKY
jgi:tetratricopeptide (TPR) repeat protein